MCAVIVFVAVRRSKNQECRVHEWAQALSIISRSYLMAFVFISPKGTQADLTDRLKEEGLVVPTLRAYEGGLYTTIPGQAQPQLEKWVSIPNNPIKVTAESSIWIFGPHLEDPQDIFFDVEVIGALRRGQICFGRINDDEVDEWIEQAKVFLRR